MNKNENWCKTFFYDEFLEFTKIFNIIRFDMPESKKKFVPDHNVEPEHIRIEFEVDFNKELITTTTTFNLLIKTERLNKITFDAKNLLIHNVLVNNIKSDFENTGKKLHVFLKESVEKNFQRGKKVTVIINSSVEKPLAGAYFVKPSPEYPQKHMHLWTQFQDEDASFVIPCFDHPSFKQTSEVIIKNIPKNMIAISNGSLIEKTENSYHYKFDVPHSIYLVSIVIGNFTEIQDSWDNIPISFYVHSSKVEDGHRSFDKTLKMVQFFSEFIGVRYPYHKYSQIAVSDFIFGGMENTTVTTQTDLTLHDVRAHIDFSSDGLVAHELAHQWFGDLLTCKEWAHAWLNESFATYFQALFVEHDLGKDEFDYEMLNKAEIYFNEDTDKYRRPIVYNKYVEPIELFDSHLYPGGAWRLHMLRQKFGTEEFKRVIKYYVEQNKFSNVETIDLQRAFEKITGVNVDSFFDQWLYSAGYPLIEFDYSWKEDKSLLELKITETQNVEEIQLFKFKTKIKIVLQNGNEKIIEIEIKEKTQTTYMYLDEKPLYASFDPQNDILKKLSIITKPEFLKNQIKSDPELTGRIYAIRSLQKVNSIETIKFLGLQIKEENFWGVKIEIAKALGFIGGSAAEEFLLAALSERHPKARRGIVSSLKQFPNSSNCILALENILKNSDESYFVESEACKSLGLLKQNSSFNLLVKQLEKDSFQEVIRQGVLEGLVSIQTTDSFNILIEWTKIGKPIQARTTAIVSLAKLGKIINANLTFEILSLLAQENNFRIKMATIAAFQILSDKNAIKFLTKFQDTEADGRIKRIAYMTKIAIQKELERPQELDLLKSEIEKLREENKEIRNSINKLDAK